jgi:hypothetical protein
VPIKMQMTGLRELQTSLARVAPEAKREFTAQLRTIGKAVADDAAAEMPQRKGRARKSLKVKVVTGRGFEGVQISEGGAVAPYVPWLDFGGKVGRGRRSHATVSVHAGGRVSVRRHGSAGTGSVTREFIKGGRYLYPAYERRYDDMVAATLDAVAKAASAAGLEVKTS